MPHKLSAVLISGRPQTARSRPGLLEFGDKKVVERTLAAYSDFAQVILVVTGDLQGFPPAGGNLKVVGTPEGASVGEQVRAGLGAMDSSNQGFALGLLDQALLTPELVNAMAEKFLGGKAKILVPLSLKQIGQPAFFRSALSADFTKLAEGETAWAVLKKNGDEVDTFDTNETTVLRNIEDIDDYHAMLHLAGLPVPEPAEEGADS